MGDERRGLIAPTIDADSAIWWAGLQRGEITLQRCAACRRFRSPPLPACPYCGAPDSTVQPASGRGRIYSWVTIRRSLSPQFVGEEPYTVLAVDLDEGPRVFGRLLGGDPQADAAVVAEVYTVEGTALLGFVIASGPTPSSTSH